MSTQQIDATMVPYQVLNEEGRLVGPLPDMGASAGDTSMYFYRTMSLARAFSNKIIALQRQGRATTFGSLVGQEATAIGLAAPLQAQDWLATSYREIGSHIIKGVPLTTLIYSFRGFTPTYPQGVNCLPIQIVIGTQMLHAVGLAMGAKLSGEPAVAVGVCGDGATSEGDFSEALNFAGVYKAPVVLVVQNNGWAISVPRKRQSAATTLAVRGVGFGLPSRLVDGNDIFAVYAVMREAVERARAGDGPTLVEALTYRIGAHTTADDPTRYRDEQEVEAWRAKDPLARLRRYLLAEGLLTEESDRELQASVEEEVNEAASEALAMPPNAPDSFFAWASENPSPRLQAQHTEMLRALRQSQDERE
ncbi:pyruvate dehydrogenase (acetyl-transferring) E1 component subunit alpha [Ktedonospora formicarum]|uniref:Pyruvate dehydrogenase E1 component subunit alpha n=1 Tax=Ktedonospora formicarum TaxID=2778364 RepID=A0A8J3MP75_9CHLR|nr:pyruvate dehydrogenase (acetyl-transferring) E1 component subunit alpha [Ktedonospora formicarum]GHO43542.1 pyruvate dehydrogenase (acetyl-transferring) E1 component subunit alpha [Ktedonospora formicarum]